MKIKNLFSTVLVLITIAAVFSGCSFLDKDNDDSSSQKGRLLFFADSNARAANTVNPASFNFTSDSGLTFTLTGTISGGTNQTIGTWSDSESTKAYSRMTSDTSILVDVGSWTFRLSVTKNGSEILYGTKTLSVSAGNNPLDFGTLKEASTDDTTRDSNIQIAKGSVNVTLSFPSDSGVKGTAASLTAIDSEETGSEKSFEVTTSGTTSSTTYSQEDVDAGAYILAIKLYSDSETKDDTTYLNTYTALVNVAPGCESKGSAELSDINTLYTIKYELNGGSFAGTVQTSYNKYAKITLPTPTRNGYDFAGWSKTSNGAETADYTDGKVISISEDTTLYALWKILTYSITYNYDSSTTNASDAVTSYTVETETFALPTPTTTTTTNVAGFGGWYTTESFDSGTKLTQVEKGTYGDLTLYAKWLTWAEYISNLTENSTVCVTGELTEDLLKEIAAAIKSGSYMVTLDLSNTTGLTTISDASSDKNGIFYQNYKLLSIVLPSSLTQIGRYTFSSCTRLASVTIPDNVTSIGNYAFYNCTSLASIAIPDSVTSIGTCAFQNCTSLSSITIPDSVTSIGDRAFNGCTSLESVTIGNGVTSIGNVFNGCTSLASVSIGGGVTSISSSAFKNCPNIENITVSDNNTVYDSRNDCNAIVKTINKKIISLVLGCKNTVIPNGVTSIGSYAFYGCTSLVSITIPDTVRSIGSYAFCGCTSLASVTIGNGVTSIFSSAFENCTGLASVTIPDSVTSIFSSAFKNCTGLATVTISDKVTSIEEKTFYGCTSLESVTIGGSVKSINECAFYGCTSLASVTIPDSVTSIGRCAFGVCTSLASVAIGNGVTSIGNGAFNGCTSLASITIPDSVTSIGSSAFRNCSSLEEITIPFVGGSADATEASESTLFGYIFGEDYNRGSGTVQYYTSDSSECYLIPSSVKKVTVTGGNILYGAFYNCKNFTNVTIGKDVNHIGKNAFYGCTSLTSIEFEDSDSWCYTDESDYTGGYCCDVSSASDAAKYLSSKFVAKYWFKY